MKNAVTRVTRCKMHQFLTGSWNFAWLPGDYSLVTRCLFVHALLQLFAAASHKVPN